MNVIGNALSSPSFKARSVNQTSATAVSRIPTITEPKGDAGTATGASIIELAPISGGVSRGGIVIEPYGTGSENSTFNIRVLGWKCIGHDTPQTRLWRPVKLCEVQVTLCTVVGIAGYQIINTERFVDTIALVGTSGNANVSMEMISPADDTIAHFSVALKGYQKVELSFFTGSSATDCNALVSLT